MGDTEGWRPTSSHQTPRSPLPPPTRAAFEFHGVPPSERFPLGPFLDGPLARLLRKPLRVAFTIERLGLALDADAGLAVLRDFFERLAREFESKSAARGGSGGGGGSGGEGGPPREPLHVQLELLDLWHASLSRLLRAFKQRFRSAGATLLASADRRVFQFGAESVAYDGPLKLKVPLDLAMDPDGSFVLDLRLPDREQAANSLTSLLTEVMYSLSTTHSAAAAAAAAAGVAPTPAPAGGSAGGSGARGSPASGRAADTPTGTGTPREGSSQHRPALAHPSHASTAQAVAAHAALVTGLLGSPDASVAGPGGGASGGGGWEEAAAFGGVGLGPEGGEAGLEWAAALAEGAAAEARAAAAGAGAGSAPLLANPVVGQLCIKKLALSLRLDEDRVAQLLAGGGPVTLPLPLPTPSHPSPSTASSAFAAPASAHGPSADIAGRLLGCYGDLFTASLDTGFRPVSDDDGAVQKPCCMLTVQSNEVTRLRADVEGLWFQSWVPPPKLAVRVLQAVVIALVLKFHAADSYSIRFWNRAFDQLHEYLSRGSLDLAVCLSARATMDRTTDRLRVELSGQDLNASHTPGAAGAGAAGGGLLGRVCPVYLLNDINLLTVLDSVKLLSEAPAAAAAEPGPGKA
ncbi:hypothetical protein HYH03_012135 [Edaphochlamys debaryana]|uniref:Uncharacterized protein n=1 Tax=Edaphochlamys debaryana TaxID=47281 RepID=A0A835XSA8_9CHLO|nr:hypothetical protein HYH03_012135 [Edaphochlamys debaryana]|eukprot:KAG2489303.1 hypothetical protein HYH03_012135 [Edaphochlamys debaryana]